MAEIALRARLHRALYFCKAFALRCVRTAAIVTLCQVAVRAKQLKVVLRIPCSAQPSVKGFPASNFSPMRGSVFADVIKCQKLWFGNPTATAPTAISCNHLQAERLQTLPSALTMLFVKAVRGLRRTAAVAQVSMAATFAALRPTSIFRASIAQISIKFLNLVAGSTKLLWYGFRRHAARVSLTRFTTGVAWLARGWTTSCEPLSILSPSVLGRLEKGGDH